MYIVEFGVAGLTKRTLDGLELEIGRIRANGFFGEIALISSKPRTFSAYAIENMRLLYIDVKQLRSVVGSCADLLHRNFTEFN